MRVFFRAVITGFGWSLGAAIYRKVSERLENQTRNKATAEDGAASSVDANSDGVIDAEDGTDDGEPVPA